MVLLTKAAEETAETFVVGFLQPFPELMIGGTQHLLLSKILFMLDDLLNAGGKLGAPENPFEQLFLRWF